MKHTTFRKAREAGACIESYRKMAKVLGGVKNYGQDTPIGLEKVLDVCGLDDTIWTFRCMIEDSERLARLFACDCAEHVLHFFENEYPNDNRPRRAVEIARKYANGEATANELVAARDAAGAAAGAAGGAAWGAAWDAAWAAGVAAGVAARVAAGVAARVAAWVAEREWQTQRLLEYLKGE